MLSRADRLLPKGPVGQNSDARSASATTEPTRRSLPEFCRTFSSPLSLAAVVKKVSDGRSKKAYALRLMALTRSSPRHKTRSRIAFFWGDSMMRNTLLLSAALVLADAPSVSARMVFFNNFPYSNIKEYFVCGRDGCGGGFIESPAMQFVPGVTGTTSKISVSVSAYDAGPANVQILLRADKNGLPGRVLAKKNATGQPCCVTTTVMMAVNLIAGTPYWLEIAPRTTNDSALWQLSDSLDWCTVAEDYNGTGWSASSTQGCPAERITGGIK